MIRYELSRAWPPVKGMLFCLLPLVYYLTGVLNSSQAGKAALLGFSTLTMLFCWREIFPRLRSLRVLLFISLLLLSAGIVFQVSIRQIFGMQQDDVLVVQALLNTNVEEGRGFIFQHLHHIAVHLLLAGLFVAGYWLLLAGPLRLPAGRQGAAAVRTRRIITASLFTFLVVLVHSNTSVSMSNPLFYFAYNYQKAGRDMAMARDLGKKLAGGEASGLLAGVSLERNVRRRTVVLVLGESDTRSNWTLYGYGRETTPELAKLQDQLLIFQDVVAADGATVGSISKMLTAATADQPDLWKSRPTVMAVARHLGYKVFWIANQGLQDRGVVPILASQADTTVFTNTGIDRGESSLDEVLLLPYRRALDDPAEKKLIIVHLHGAHPAYNFRYPENFGIFEEVYDDQVARGLKEQGRAPWAILFRNMYDCAIRYEDHILAQLLRRLMEKEQAFATWLYVSDHGQDVAHNTDYSGHNIRVRQQWEVPFVLWQTEDRRSEVPAADLVARPYQADVLDHTILGLLGVRGDIYEPERDILAAGFKAERILPRRMRVAGYD
jgi:heptose-I-phosphate ethanolaminephosphotransferase